MSRSRKNIKVLQGIEVKASEKIMALIKTNENLKEWILEMLKLEKDNKE